MFQILIVDDTKSVHAFAKSLLCKAKEIETTSAYDGTDAVARFLRGDKYDLVLLDWEMPNLNGPDTFEKLKGMGVAVPTIMMTTKNAPSDIQRMLEAGVAEYLMKPFTADILFEKIEFASGKALLRAA
jgi:two-component system chemotaxis response regulator CheY